MKEKKWTHAWTCVAIGGVIDHVETRVDFLEAISLPFRARMFVEKKEIRSTIVMGIVVFSRWKKRMGWRGRGRRENVWKNGDGSITQFG